MVNVFIRKLDAAGGLNETDHETLRRLSSHDRLVPARQDLIREGDRTETVYLVLSGFACCYKILPRGRRCISGLMVPGDFCDPRASILDEMDHSIATMTDCTVVEIPRQTMWRLIEDHPRIAHAVCWSMLVDGAVTREWLIGIARRLAPERMAHLFCELLLRLRAVGLAASNEYALPFTQSDLADMLGLTPIHVNRVLRDLRSRGLIMLSRRRLRILDEARLIAFCGFNPNYLHRIPVIDRISTEKAMNDR